MPTANGGNILQRNGIWSSITNSSLRASVIHAGKCILPKKLIIYIYTHTCLFIYLKPLKKFHKYFLVAAGKPRKNIEGVT
jgi:hypothetical protein